MALDMTTALTIKANVVGQGQVDKFGKSLVKVGQNSNKASTGLRNLTKAGNSLTGVLARIGTGFALKKVFGDASLLESANTRINALVGSYSKYDGIQALAGKSAKKFRLTQTEALAAFADLGSRLGGTNTSLEDLGNIYDGFNTLLVNNKVGAQQASAAQLQLGQALGEGVLRAEEYNSLIATTPQLLDEVARVMEVPRAGLKKLAGEGEISSEALIQALANIKEKGADQLEASLSGAFGASREFNTAMTNISTTIGTELLPAFVPLINAATGLLNIFGTLPGSVKTLLAAVAGLVAAVAILAPAIAAVAPALAAIGSLTIGATIAGWLPAIVGIGGALKGLAVILVGVFSGPVGWVALLVAAGVAIYSFRDEIGQAFKVIGDILKAAAKSFMDLYVKPILVFGQGLVNGLVSMFQKLAEMIKAPFTAIVGFIKGIMNSVLSEIAGRINSAIGLINRLISAYNRLPTPNIPSIPNVNVPQFAKGGVVDGPTLAMVGEGGESEYIVPQSKASGFAKNWMAGRRGIGAIPGFAEGGVVNAGGGSSGAGNTTVQVTTGPILQQEGKNYVTVRDLEGALKQLSSQMYKNQRSYGGRRFQGVAG